METLARTLQAYSVGVAGGLVLRANLPFECYKLGSTKVGCSEAFKGGPPEYLPDKPRPLPAKTEIIQLSVPYLC